MEMLRGVPLIVLFAAYLRTRNGTYILAGFLVILLSTIVLSLIARIIHRFWATCRKLLDKNRLDFKASRLRIRQSNRKREIESRSHLSRLLVSQTRHVG